MNYPYLIRNNLSHVLVKWAETWDFQQCGMCGQQSLRSACAYAQSDQSLCLSLAYSMNIKLLTEHHLEFLSLKGDCTGLSKCHILEISCRGSNVLKHCRCPMNYLIYLTFITHYLLAKTNKSILYLGSVLYLEFQRSPFYSLNFKPFQGFIHKFREKAPGQNREKMINLTSKFGEINDLEHNKGSKIYCQNHVILDCIISNIALKH